MPLHCKEPPAPSVAQFQQYSTTAYRSQVPCTSGASASQGTTRWPCARAHPLFSERVMARAARQGFPRDRDAGFPGKTQGRQTINTTPKSSFSGGGWQQLPPLLLCLLHIYVLSLSLTLTIPVARAPSLPLRRPFFFNLILASFFYTASWPPVVPHCVQHFPSRSLNNP